MVFSATHDWECCIILIMDCVVIYSLLLCFCESWLWSSARSSCCVTYSRFWKPMKSTGNVFCASCPLCWFTTRMPSQNWEVNQKQHSFIMALAPPIILFCSENREFLIEIWNTVVLLNESNFYFHSNWPKPLIVCTGKLIVYKRSKFVTFWVHYC